MGVLSDLQAKRTASLSGERLLLEWDLQRIHVTEVKGECSLEIFFYGLSAKFNEYAIPAQVKIEESRIDKKVTPCITIVHNEKSKDYYSFCFTMDFEYGITYLKTYQFGKSTIGNLRRINNGDNKYVRQYQKEWEAEQRYYQAITRVYNEILGGE